MGDYQKGLKQGVWETLDGEAQTARYMHKGSLLGSSHRIRLKMGIMNTLMMRGRCTVGSSKTGFQLGTLKSVFDDPGGRDYYSGGFTDLRANGKGELDWRNGDRYVGRFQNGKEHGQ